MPSPDDPRQNHLLSILPADGRERVFPHLELIPIPLGHVVYESGVQMGYIIFPTTSLGATGIIGSAEQPVHTWPPDSFG